MTADDPRHVHCSASGTPLPDLAGPDDRACGRASPALLMPILKSLLMRGPNATDSWHAQGVSGYNLEVHWDEVQPDRTGALRAVSIDDAIHQVHLHNQDRFQHPWGLRMRIQSGLHAPDWAVARGGGAIPIVGLQLDNMKVWSRTRMNLDISNYENIPAHRGHLSQPPLYRGDDALLPSDPRRPMPV